MKVMELFEREAPNAESRIKQLESKLAQVNADLKKIRSPVGQGAAEPKYEALFKKLTAERKDLTDKIKLEKDRIGSAEKSREFDKERATEKPEDRQKRHNQAKSEGINKANSLRSEAGGWEGLAKKVATLVHDALGSKDTLSTEQVEKIASKLETTTRTLYKWFERPEFKHLRKHLARRY